MQLFYKNTIASKFIKNLIATSNIPTIDFYRDDSNVVDGGYYIKNNSIVKAKIDVNNNISYKAIQPYVFNEKYDGFTSSYQSSVIGYDSETHRLLGEYLRAIKGNFNINLMPFYNCFNDSYIEDIDIEDGKIIDNYTGDDLYKIISVPVKFNTTYTIAIDCGTPIQVANILYGPRGHINIYGIDEKNKLDSNIELYVNSSFKNPFTYTTTVSNSVTYPYSRYLRMIIKVPASNKSSIVVLEGDYTNLPKWDLERVNYYTSGPEIIGDLPKKLSQLSLLQINDNNNYPFSDALLPYLLLNVIDPLDDIENNIIRIQQYASSNINSVVNNTTPFPANYTPGIWSDELRDYLYTLTTESSNIMSKLDINGYVDRNVEKIITRGQGV